MEMLMLTMTRQHEGLITPEHIRSEIRAITEATALAVGPHIGGRDKIAADGAAVEAMRSTIEQSQLITCRVIIGEGEKDDAPMLEHRQTLGNGPVLYDMADDPIEGTSRTVEGRDGGMALFALGPEGSFMPWVPGLPYMKKLVVPKAAVCALNSTVELMADPRDNLRELAHALGRPATELRVAVLDRERNGEIMEAIEALGARAILLDSGDVLPALQACRGDGDVDILYGSGGSPEAVLTAAAVAGLNGGMLARWDPQDSKQHAVHDALPMTHRGGGLTDLIGDGRVFFSATAITDGPFLDGLRFNKRVNSWELGANPSMTTYREPDVRYPVAS
jgi:fructose-1,6-bisphosphatase II